MIIVTAMGPVLRRLLAVAAAYAVVLQAALTAFAVVAPTAAAEQFVICRADQSGAPAAPLSHDPCGACLAGHCGGAASPERITALTVPQASRGPATDSSHIVAFAPEQPRTNSHLPRAPPFA